jgi:hypothetical protein
MDLLGPAWSEGSLLALGFSIEQTLKLRRPPFSTPALVNGKAPSPVSLVVPVEEGNDRLAVIEFTHDTTTSRLTYKTTFTPRGAMRVKQIWIHRMAAEKPGAAVYQLFAGSGSSSTGSVTLSYEDRGALETGRLRLRFHTDEDRSPLTVPLPRVTSAH